MILGDAVSKLETFVWILNHISKFITWSMFTLKTSNLVKWPISTFSFMWWCQIVDWLKFETHPSSQLNFGMAYRQASHPNGGGCRRGGGGEYADFTHLPTYSYMYLSGERQFESKVSFPRTHHTDPGQCSTLNCLIQSPEHTKNTATTWSKAV